MCLSRRYQKIEDAKQEKERAALEGLNVIWYLHLAFTDVILLTLLNNVSISVYRLRKESSFYVGNQHLL